MRQLQNLGRTPAQPNFSFWKAASAPSAFGESLSADTSNSQLSTHNSQTFYTGKPHVLGLGHAFLFRNYRATLGKWQTADPLGYPDGWNQLAYCGNLLGAAFDLAGCYKVNDGERVVYDRPIDGIWHYGVDEQGRRIKYQWWEKLVDVTWGIYEGVGSQEGVDWADLASGEASIIGFGIGVIGLATGGIGWAVAGVVTGAAGLAVYFWNDMQSGPKNKDVELRRVDEYVEHKYSTRRVVIILE